MKLFVCGTFALLFALASLVCLYGWYSGTAAPEFSWTNRALLYWLVADKWTRLAEEKGPRP